MCFHFRGRNLPSCSCGRTHFVVSSVWLHCGAPALYTCSAQRTTSPHSLCWHGLCALSFRMRPAVADLPRAAHLCLLLPRRATTQSRCSGKTHQAIRHRISVACPAPSFKGFILRPPRPVPMAPGRSGSAHIIGEGAQNASARLLPCPSALALGRVRSVRPTCRRATRQCLSSDRTRHDAVGRYMGHHLAHCLKKTCHRTQARVHRNRGGGGEKRHAKRIATSGEGSADFSSRRLRGYVFVRPRKAVPKHSRVPWQHSLETCTGGHSTPS